MWRPARHMPLMSAVRCNHRAGRECDKSGAAAGCRTPLPILPAPTSSGCPTIRTATSRSRPSAWSTPSVSCTRCPAVRSSGSAARVQAPSRAGHVGGGPISGRCWPRSSGWHQITGTAYGPGDRERLRVRVLPHCLARDAPADRSLHGRAMNSDERPFPGSRTRTSGASSTRWLAGTSGSDKVSPLPPAPNVLDVSTQSLCPLQVDGGLRIPGGRRGLRGRNGSPGRTGAVAGPAPRSTAPRCAPSR